jgi:putative chitobiose transport system permease protein
VIALASHSAGRSPRGSGSMQLRRIRVVALLGLVLRYVVMCAIAVLMIGPFYWLLVLSFRGGGNIYSFRLIPEHITGSNFLVVWTEFELWINFYNSVIVGVASVGLNLLLASLAAYPLARLTFPGRTLVFYIILSTLMVPFQLYMIPLLLLCIKIGVNNTLMGVYLPFSVGAFGVYLIKQYYHTIPQDLEEAARVDGAGEFTIWWRIMFPLTKPALATLAIFVFVFSWSNFLWPLIILNDPRKFTLPVKLAQLIGVFVDKTHYLAAGSVIAVVPIIVFFLLLQRFFIGGITIGAVKG